MHGSEYMLMITFRVAVVEIALSGVNYFLLINRAYAPRVGKLRAHQIGMTTRIGYIFVFAYFIPYFANTNATLDLLLAGGSSNLTARTTWTTTVSSQERLVA